MSTQSPERGSATILVVSAVLGLAVLAAVAMTVGGLITAQVRASQAADLAALAGARMAWSGTAAACAEAGRIASVQDAQLSACERRGLDIQVQVVVRPALPMVLSQVNGAHASDVALRATARAGPPEDSQRFVG